MARVLPARARTRIALVGAGAGGVELLLSVEHRLRREVAARRARSGRAVVRARYAGVARSCRAFRRRSAPLFASILAARGIAVFAGAAVTRVEAGRLVLDGRRTGRGRRDSVDDPSSAGALAGQEPDCRSTGGLSQVAPSICVSWGTTTCSPPAISSLSRARELPKSGVYAVRAGPVLADNIRRTLTGRALRPFRPQRKAMYLVSTGDAYAVGTRNGLVFKGAWVWRWKDWIDRRFMRSSTSCRKWPRRARAGRQVLGLSRWQSPHRATALKEISAHRHALRRLRRQGRGDRAVARACGSSRRRADVIVGLDAPDDAALVDTGGEQLSVQTVDYFRAMVDDPYMFGQIAANHALGDIYAMGGEPQSALAIATVPFGSKPRSRRIFPPCCVGANEVLREADCALVGGHTSEGAELALGFAVNGLVRRSGCLRKGGRGRATPSS